MGKRTLSDEQRRYLALFEDETGATATDCVVDEEFDRVLILVSPGEMGQAIGPSGQHVQDVEATIGTNVKIVEDADRPEELVANALAPAAVYNVTISESDEEAVAYAEVDDADTGVAIGTDGRTIEAARLLARRHFDVDDVELA
jgi:N utilization substance protein A